MISGKKKWSLLNRFHSIQQEIFLMFFFLVLSAVGIFTLFSLKYTSTAIFENSVTYARQLTAQVNNDIDSYITYMENISAVVAESPDVRSYMFKENEEARGRIQAQFRTILNSREDVYNLGVIRLGQKALINGDGSRVNEYVAADQLDWYNQSMKHPDEIILSSAHVQHVVEGDRPWVITMSRYIKGYESGQGAVLFVDLNYSAIRKLCQESSVGQKGYIFILDRDGNIVYHPQQQQLYNELQTENIEEIRSCLSDYLEMGKGKDAKLYTISQSEKTGWTVVSCANIPELLKRNSQARITYLITAVVLMAAALILSSIVSRGITRPIQKLRVSMKKVQEGNFNEGNVEVEAVNEIGSLTEAFNVMTRKIRELMEQNVYEQKEKRKSEIRALQSQINPHFLYNTLDSIIWMAEGKKNEEVVQMTAALARLLRQCISNEEEKISVAQEAEYCRSYLIIQKMRYKDKLEYEIRIDDSIKRYPIMKLMLQPLIENAIYHGLKYKEGKGMLVVNGYAKEDFLIFEIRDNGVGMDPETLAHIFERHRVNYQSNGVGVYNVQKRIQLTYGQKYGISYESRQGEGTVCSITIPMERGDGK